MTRPLDDDGYVPGEVFHQPGARVYAGRLGWAANKKSAGMARVVYEAVHLNEAENGVRRGFGKDYATWILSEEPGLEEGLFDAPFQVMIDARLEPNAAIGLHEHPSTEEVYYVLWGTLDMTTVSADGAEHTERLEAGDAHFVRRGQAHYGQAGGAGARFIAVSVRV